MVAWDQALYSPTAPVSAYPGPHLERGELRDPPERGVDARSSSRRASASPGTSRAPVSTVVRGGFGMYRYHEPQSIYSDSLDFAQRGEEP